MHIVKGDKVVVISGNHKGQTGEVLEVRPRENRVLVKGLNQVKRHQRPCAFAGSTMRTAPRSGSAWPATK